MGDVFTGVQLQCSQTCDKLETKSVLRCCCLDFLLTTLLSSLGSKTLRKKLFFKK